MTDQKETADDVNARKLMVPPTPERQRQLAGNVVFGGDGRMSKPVLQMKYASRFALADAMGIFEPDNYSDAMELFDLAWNAFRVWTRELPVNDNQKIRTVDLETGLPLRSIFVRLQPLLTEDELKLLKWLDSPLPDAQPYQGYADCKTCCDRHASQHIARQREDITMRGDRIVDVMRRLEHSLYIIRKDHQQQTKKNRLCK